MFAKKGTQIDVKFYKCLHCGNIVVKVYDAGPEVVCCGEPMVELVADTQDAALEKHVPDVTIDGNHIHVNIGSVDHPMIPEHYIHFICLVKGNGYEIHPLDAGGAPCTDFYLGEGEVAKTVYEYCNLHGLWKLDL